MTSEQDQVNKEEQPPIFKTWRIHYLVVLLFHALMILLFSWLTISFQ